MISFASALTFDNRLKSYDEETKTVIIDDNFGLGGDLVKIKLIENTYKCGVSCYTIWNVTIYADDDNFLTDLIFQQIKGSGGVSESKFEFVSGYDSVVIDDYAKDCRGVIEGEMCNWVVVGNHIEEIEIWTEFDPRRKLPVGNYIIKLTGKKLTQDTIDWIPTFYGKEISQWAFWASTNPTSYYNFNEVNGSTQALDFIGLNNLTVNTTTAGFGPGKLANGYSPTTLGAGGVGLNATVGASEFILDENDFTISYWVNGTALSGSQGVIDHNPSTATGWGINRLDSGLVMGFQSNSVVILNTTLNLNDGNFHNVVWVRDGLGSNQFRVYVDNVNQGNATLNVNMSSSIADFAIGISNNLVLQLDDLQIYNGFAWSVADVNFSYNNGPGREANITGSVSITLISPDTGLNTSNTSLVFVANYTTDAISFTNTTLFVWNSNTTLFNTNFTTITGLSNQTNLSMGSLISSNSYIWNYFGCVNDTAIIICDMPDVNRTFTIVDNIIISTNFNASVNETELQTFQLNLSVLSTTISVESFLEYNSTRFASTTSCDTASSSCLITNTIDIPLITTAAQLESRNFFWDNTFSNGTGTSQSNTTTFNQNVSRIRFEFCNASNPIAFINITFKNETINQEDVSATADTTWTYWLGSGPVNKTLTFANSSQNLNYSFCFFPPDKSLNAIQSIAYNNLDSQQRIFDQQLLLTNSSLAQTLFLLPTSLGILNQFVTTNLIGNTLANIKATITRTLGSSVVTVSSDTTDDSGLVIFFLNPDITYTGTFTGGGFAANVFSFVPATDLRTVIMGATTTTTINGSTIGLNTTYQTFPSNGSLINNTDFLFGFNVTSSQPITLISMNISNSSGFQLSFQSSIAAGFISDTVNTGNLSQIIGIFTYATATESITVTRLWIVGNDFVGDYSIFRQFKLYTTYGFRDFFRLVIVLFALMGLLIFMSSNELTDTSESKIIASLLLIWAFSIVGWLDNPAVTSTTGLAEFGKQYGIAILSTAGASFFILRRLFIRKV